MRNCGGGGVYIAGVRPVTESAICLAADRFLSALSKKYVAAKNVNDEKYVWFKCFWHIGEHMLMKGCRDQT